MQALRMNRWGLALALGLSAALVGCSGGDDSEPAPVPVVVDPLAAVPTEATLSGLSLVDYQKTLSMTLSETREAIDLSSLTLPSSDNTEPVSLD